MNYNRMLVKLTYNYLEFRLKNNFNNYLVDIFQYNIIEGNKHKQKI